MLLTLVVGLYTSRVVLSTLGVSDYGLYNVVGGFVTMLTFLSSTLTNGSQRFLTYEIGTGNIERLKRVFTTSLSLHMILAGICFIIAETIGVWFLNTQMNIPEGREFAAFWVYQFSIVTFLITIVQVPFISCLIAHEKMDIYAYMSIYDVVMKLIVVFLIQISNLDKLIFYAALICMVQVSSALLYNIYTRNKFEECVIKTTMDKELVKEMAGFSGWTLIGALGCSANGQGINILLNIFFGTVVNAARGVAFQVNNIVVGFSRNFQLAANPQIIKLYAEGRVDEMTKLVIRSSKFSAFLMLFIMLPVIFNIDFMLRLWLGDYPEYTDIFVILVLIQSLIQSMSGPVVTATHAGGKLKMPNLTGGLSILMALPICYIALKFGCSPVLVFILNMIPWLFECYFDAYYAQKYTRFSMWRFYKEVYVRVFLVFIISSSLIYSCACYIKIGGWLRFLSICTFCVIISIMTIYLFGLNKDERVYAINMIKNKLHL